MPDDKITPGEYKAKSNGDGSYRVVNTVSGKVHSEHSSKADADHQVRLLYAVGHGWKPTHGS